MLIDVYSVMNNERVLLPYWLRHYETFADRIFVWDDQSDDGTREMLEAHPLVKLLPLDRYGDDDPYWIKDLFPQYETYSRGQADWVIITDADEFIYHPRMREVLEQETAKGTQVIWCKGYAMIADTPPSGNGYIYEEIKQGLPDRLESKWTIFDPAEKVRFRKGRHGGLLEGGQLKTNADTGIKLFHYRYLGEQFFIERDKRNAARLEKVIKIGYQYDPKKIRTLPDRSRGVALEWYAAHKAEAVNVVDDG